MLNHRISNELNQYTAIDSFTPQYDADGNQTLIKTSTGIWSVTYNAENRPVRWESGDTVITMNFDRMGRRTLYKEEVNGVVTKHHRFVYDNYLCVQKVDTLNNNAQINLFVWDPTEPIATRPLFTQRGTGYKFFYTCDGNKNISELVHFETRNGIAAPYDYAPFGAVTRAISASAVTDNTFTIDNPFRFPSPDGLGRIFSSEYHDDTLGLVYYRERERTFHGHYRHYNPIDGRWSVRDPKGEAGGLNIYTCVVNNISNLHDSLGLDRHVVYYLLYTICGIPIFPKIHAEIVVDLWECHNGQWYEKGVARYSSGPKGMNPFSSEGSVSSSTSYDNDTLVMTTIKSLPCEDIALIKELRANQRIHPPRYYVIGSNCYNFVFKMAYFGLGCNE